MTLEKQLDQARTDAFIAGLQPEKLKKEFGSKAESSQAAASSPPQNRAVAAPSAPGNPGSESAENESAKGVTHREGICARVSTNNLKNTRMIPNDDYEESHHSMKVGRNHRRQVITKGSTS